MGTGEPGYAQFLAGAVSTIVIDTIHARSGPGRRDGHMSMRENPRLAVIGAGSVGTSVAYAALIRGSARHIVLYDIAAEKVEAEVLDLAHGTQFTGASTITGGSDLAALKGSHVVVITAGAKQKPGQTRIELAGVNAAMIATMMPQLLEAAPDAVYVLVTNPCDVLTVLAAEASGLPANRIFSSGTVLDTSRLRWKLAERTGVSTSSVHAFIVGEHGDSEFPLWSGARIGPVPILDWESENHPRLTVEELDQIAVDVRDAAYKVIKGKGATNNAIGLASARIVEAVLQDQKAVLPVSTVLRDFHGIDGTALSVPSVVDASGAVPIRNTPFSDDELGLLERSASALDSVVKSLRT